MPGVLDGIMKNLTDKIEEEAKLNIMHMTYLAVECSSQRKSVLELKVFTDLYSEYLEESKVCITGLRILGCYDSTIPGVRAYMYCA